SWTNRQFHSMVGMLGTPGRDLSSVATAEVKLTPPHAVVSKNPQLAERFMETLPKTL
ncbi:hypothetical protein J6590_099767, partial [Homalodisca vitripennis]